MAANGTIFDPTMIDIDVYLADAIPKFDGFDEVSDGCADVNVDDTDQHKEIKPTDKIDSHCDKPTKQNDGTAAEAEKVGKMRILSENSMRTNTAKRVRMNNTYVDESIAKKKIKPPKTRKNIEMSTPTIQCDKIGDTASNSLNGISSNIAAELMKNFAFAEETLKHLVNQRLEKLLNDERAKYTHKMDAMQHELLDAKSQLQHAIAEKLEFQQIADLRSQQLKKRDRQLAQAHLDYNDLMEELHNAKYLCDTCGKTTRKTG